MEVYRRHFKVESGPLVEEVVRIQAVNKKAQGEYEKFLEEIEAKPGYYQYDHKLTGILFEGKVDKHLFKKARCGWYPKKNNKEAKALATRLEAIKTVPDKEALKVVGLAGDFPSIFGPNKAYYNSIITIPSEPPVIYLSVPWHDVDPEKLARYKKEREEKCSRKSDMEAILWEPSADIHEVKSWELDKAITEWNESLKEEEK